MQKHLITKKEREELSILLGQTCPDFCLKLDANQRLQLEDLLNEKLQENKEGFYSLVDYWSKKAIEMAENKDIVESEKIVLKIKEKKGYLENVTAKDDIARLKKELEDLEDKAYKINIDYIKSNKSYNNDSKELRAIIDFKTTEIALDLLEITGQNKEYDIVADDTFLQAMFWLFYAYKPNNMPSFLVLARQKVSLQKAE